MSGITVTPSPDTSDVRLGVSPPGLCRLRRRRYNPPLIRDLIVLAAICLLGPADARHASAAHLGAMAGYSTRTVRTALSSLEARGWLSWIRCGGPRYPTATRCPNAYTVHAMEPEAAAVAVKLAWGVRRLTTAERRREERAQAAARAAARREGHRRALHAGRRASMTEVRIVWPSLPAPAEPQQLHATSDGLKKGNVNGETMRNVSGDSRANAGPPDGGAPYWSPWGRCEPAATRWPDMPWHIPGRDDGICIECGEPPPSAGSPPGR
jgi:hypothetical protein